MGLDISYHGGSSYPHERPAAGSTGSLRMGSEAVRGAPRLGQTCGGVQGL